MLRYAVCLSVYNGLIGSRIRAFDWSQNQSPWMILNDQNVTVAVIKKVLRSPPEKFER